MKKGLFLAFMIAAIVAATELKMDIGTKTTDSCPVMTEQTQPDVNLMAKDDPVPEYHFYCGACGYYSVCIPKIYECPRCHAWGLVAERCLPLIIEI